MDKRKIGNYGEALATVFLEEKGFTLVEENYRCPFGEADLILYGDGAYHFVEVKTRERRPGYSPSDAINSTKKQRMRKVALCYMREQGWPDVSMSLDLVEIELDYIENI